MLPVRYSLRKKFPVRVGNYDSNTRTCNILPTDHNVKCNSVCPILACCKLLQTAYTQPSPWESGCLGFILLLPEDKQDCEVSPCQQTSERKGKSSGHLSGQSSRAILAMSTDNCVETCKESIKQLSLILLAPLQSTPLPTTRTFLHNILSSALSLRSFEFFKVRGVLINSWLFSASVLKI